MKLFWQVLCWEVKVIDREGSDVAFIVGSPRSGTTWLQQLIASHPRVKTGPESYIFDRYIGSQLKSWQRETEAAKERGFGVGMVHYLSQDEFKAYLTDYLLALFGAMTKDLGPGEVFVEKTPEHALFLPEILTLLPKSKIIHIVRDPREVVASIMHLGEIGSWGSSNPRTATRIWLQHVERVGRSAKGLDGTQFHELKYEALLSSTVEELAKIFSFLGIESDRATVERVVERSNVGGDALVRPKGWKEKVPAVQRSRDRRSTQGKERRNLSTVERYWVWREARVKMSEYGYTWPDARKNEFFDLFVTPVASVYRALSR